EHKALRGAHELMQLSSEPSLLLPATARIRTELRAIASQPTPAGTHVDEMVNDGMPSIALHISALGGSARDLAAACQDPIARRQFEEAIGLRTNCARGSTDAAVAAPSLPPHLTDLAEWTGFRLAGAAVHNDSATAFDLASGFSAAVGQAIADATLAA